MSLNPWSSIPGFNPADGLDDWRRHMGFRRWQEARREWREGHPQFRYRDFLAEHQRRVVEQFKTPDDPE